MSLFVVELTRATHTPTHNFTKKKIDVGRTIQYSMTPGFDGFYGLKSFTLGLSVLYRFQL